MSDGLPGNRQRLVRRASSRQAAMRVVLAGTVAALALAPLQANAQPPRPRVKFRTFPVDVVLDTLVVSRDTVTATPAQAFEAVRQTYAALKVPREHADSVNGQVGTLRHRVTNALGGQRLSVYFSCGQGIVGPNADMWRITMAMVTFIQPAGEGTVRLGTGVVAEAQDMSGTSTEPARCGSTGLLESRVHKDVRARLGKP